MYFMILIKPILIKKLLFYVSAFQIFGKSDYFYVSVSIQSSCKVRLIYTVHKNIQMALSYFKNSRASNKFIKSYQNWKFSELNLQYAKVESSRIQIFDNIFQIYNNLLFHQRSKMKKIYTKLFGELDMFAANPTLRSRKQPYSATPCLGAFSLLILGFFLWLFITSIIQIVEKDKSQINPSKSYQKQFDVQLIDNIMFGVSFNTKYFTSEFNASDVESYKNYFSLMVVVNQQYQYLKPCKKSQWQKIINRYPEEYYMNKIHVSYCPQQPISIQWSTESSFMIIYIGKCFQDDNPNCVSDDLFDKQIQNTIKELKYFPITINYLSPVVQVKNKQPIAYQIKQKMIALSPRSDKIAVGYALFQKLKVISDYNIWPIGEDSSQVYGFAPVGDYYSFNQIDRASDNYTLAFVHAFRNDNVQVYKRSLNKVDGALSYVGGLFGIIILAFQLCLSRYNQYKYQLKVGQSSFNYNNDGFKIRSKDLSAWVYIRYTCYTWFRLLGKKFNWTFYRQIDETRQEAKYSLDVSKFFRRLEFIERVLWKQVNPDVLRTQSLIEANSIQETKLKRHFYEYYQQVIQLQQAASVEDVLDGNKQAFVYLKQVFRSAMEKTQANPVKVQNQESGWNQQKVQQDRETPQQIKNSLMYDLRMEELEQICDKVANSNESISIALEAKKLQLKPHYDEVEEKLVESFQNLTTQQKRRVIMKVPLKILHRLRLKAMKVNKSRPQNFKNKQSVLERQNYEESDEQNNENRISSSTSLKKPQSPRKDQ